MRNNSNNQYTFHFRVIGANIDQLEKHALEQLKSLRGGVPAEVDYDIRDATPLLCTDQTVTLWEAECSGVIHL